jgi:tight adherence protein C
MGATGFDLLSVLSSPWLFAALVTVSVGLIALSLMPSTATKQIEDRLDDYVDRADVIEQEEMQGSFGTRVLFPLMRSIVRSVGTLAPSRAAASTEQLLLEAGRPYGLTVLDFFGLRLLSVIAMGGLGFWLFSRNLPLNRQVLMTGGAALAGYFVPTLWLRTRTERRKKEILQALPDALDMLTIGVEAGLAFESALLRVGDRWDNALTREFQRAVSEMRVGVGRDEALERLARRSGVPELGTFIAVLVQSNQLGVSIAQVLHNQAAEMRVKRRQKAETLANQAATKLAFPLVFLIFPSMLVVLLGPAIPTLLDLTGIAGG